MPHALVAGMFSHRAWRIFICAISFLAVLLLPAAGQVVAIPPAVSSGDAASNSAANTAFAIWYADHISANRVEVATDRVSQIIPLAHEATALAADPNDRGLWVLAHKHVLKFDDQTSLILDLDLNTLVLKPVKKNKKEREDKDDKNAYEAIEDPDALLLNPYDGSLWIGAKKTLLHIDSQGRLLLAWRSADKVEAAALGLDENLWILSKKQLIHLSAQGVVLNTYALKQLVRDEDTHFQHVAVDSLSGVLWLASEDALYQARIADLLTEPPSRIYPTQGEEDHDEEQEIKGLTLDPLTGRLWLTNRRALLGFNRSGNPLATLDLRTLGLKHNDILAFDVPTQSLWLGSKKTLAHFSHAGAFIAKIPVEEDLEAIGVSPFRLMPALALLQPRQGALSNNAKLPIRLGLNAICNDAPCNAGSSYLDKFRFNANLNGAPIGHLFTNSNGEAGYTPAERYLEGLNTVTAQATDGFGHASTSITSHFTIDTIPPEIRLQTPTATLTRTPLLIFSGSVSEPVAFSINQQPILLDSERRFNHQVTLKEGINTFELTATDLAGNVTPRTLTITLDTIPPKFLSLTPADGSVVVTPDVIIQGRLDDATATIVLENLIGLGGEIISADPANFSFKLRLKSGANSISLIAQDPAGNTSRVTLRLTYNANSVKVTNLAPGATVPGSSTAVLGTFEGPTNTGITVNGIVAQTFGNRFFVNQMPLQPGENTLTVIAHSLDGELGRHTLTVTSTGASGITVDRVSSPLASINTIAGDGTFGYGGDGGSAAQALLATPSDVALGPEGSLYVVDSSNSRVRRIHPNWVITTVAGSGFFGYNGDGIPATQAHFNFPRRLAVGPDGSLYIADYGNSRVRKVDPNGLITTVAGIGNDDEFAPLGDGGPATQAWVGFPKGLVLAPDGSLYIAEEEHRIRRVSPSGMITTVAGTGMPGFSGDGGPATQAELNFPEGLALDAGGRLYITDAGNARVRRVGLDGTITTIAGTGVYGNQGDGGPATQAALRYPSALAISPEGGLYIADAESHNIRHIAASGVITTVAGTGIEGFAGDGGAPAQAQFTFPYGLALGPDATLYIADTDNSRVRAFTTRNTQGVFPPLLVTFKLNNETGNALQKIEADYDGNGAIDFTTADPNALLQYHYTAPGVYVVQFTVTDSTNQIHTATYVLVLLDPAAMDQLLKPLWNDMNQALLNGNVNIAVKYLNESAKQKYQPIFEDLLPHMPEIIASYSSLNRLSLSENIGEYAINRQANGQNRIFLIYFLKDADGVWRLDSM